MPFLVDEDTKRRTTRCHHGFACLTKDSHQLCDVVACLDDAVMFMECHSCKECSYRANMEERTICTCPTRKKIFERYGQ